MAASTRNRTTWRLARDYSQALHWFRLAAAQGFAQDPAIQALKPGDGEAATRDEAVAQLLFRAMSSESDGSINVLILLATYRDANGVFQDDPRATRMWINLPTQAQPPAQK